MLQVSAPHLDMTLSDLQDLATRQQQQINAQQQLLASKVQLKLLLPDIQERSSTLACPGSVQLCDRTD